MSNQIVISSGAKVRSLNGVITGTTGVLDSLPINAANGIPQLDVNGKILVSQLPNSVMEYQGTWNANTNTPTLTNGGAFNQGDVYLCNVAGTTNFGAGPIAFVVGDQVIYSGSIWQRASGSTGTVTSIAVTESGDALTITGSPITTSGTINIGFAGTSAQYVAGNGALVTFPDLTGYVTLTTTQTISGVKTFTNSNIFSGNNLFTTYPNRFNEGIGIKETASYGTISGYTIIAGAASGLSLYLANGGIKTFAFANATTDNTYTFPNASGTVALTSQLTSGTVTSVGLTMPSAFNVASSPITTSGTLAVTAAGVASQYIRGDGTLADFPSSGGGGSSVSYYLNGGTSQGVIGGVTYYEMSKTADTGTGVDFPKTGNGLIVSFLTDANDPAQLNIPGGNWNYEIYVSMSANGGTPQLYAELYKYDGTTFTLISTSSNEIIYDGTNLNLYTFAMAVPTTTLTVTDRLAVKLYAANSGGKTTTVHTQNGHLCQVITTFSTGITALNGLTAQVQYLQVGTSGTDFNISSSTATHTFNLPTASAANRGALSSADWTTFNNKQSTLSLTTTGNSGSATLVSNTLNVPTYTLAGLGGISLTSLSATTPLSYNNTTGAFSIQVANTSQDGYLSSTDWNTFNSKQSTITNPVTGTGTSGQVTYFNGTSSVTSSSNFKFDGTNLTIGNPSSALAQLHVYNASAAASFLLQTNSTTDYSEIAVRNNSSTATSYFRQYSTAATGSDFGISRAGLALFFSNYATNFAIGTRNGGDLILGTADTERARITSIGIFGIGTASPSGILDVQKNQNATTNVYFRNTDTTNTNSRNILNVIAGNVTLQLQAINADNVYIGPTTAVTTYLGYNNLTTLSSTGAATFSSSVTATGGLISNGGSIGYGGGEIGLGASSSGSVGIYTNATGSPTMYFDHRGTSNTGSFIFRNGTGGANTLLTIASTGNVGIGTTSPNLTSANRTVLDINGTSTSLIALSSGGTYKGYIFNDGTDITYYSTGSTYLNSASSTIFKTSSTIEAMRITSGGNVGIGTSSPAAILHTQVTNAGAESKGLIIQNVGNTSSTAISLIFSPHESTSSPETLAKITAIRTATSFAPTDLAFYTYNNGLAERMRITSGGEILFGSTSTPYNTALFRSSYGTNTYFSFGPNNNSNSWVLWNDSGAGVYLTSGNSSWSSASDERLKNINSNIDNAVEKLMTLRPVNFSWKSDETKKENLGLIAQDVQKVFPQLIDKNTLPNDKNESIEYLGVRYVELVPVLIAAIQEQQKQIDELKAKIK